jgi:hypothetical protein
MGEIKRTFNTGPHTYQLVLCGMVCGNQHGCIVDLAEGAEIWEARLILINPIPNCTTTGLALDSRVR